MEQLRKIRLKQGLSLRTLGVMAGVHAVSLVRLEGGKCDPRLSTLRKLAQALEVSVCDLIDQPQTKKGGPHYGTDKTKGRVVRGVSRRR
jgi:transcriptional regulator with XRE-family HTH domain